MLRNRFFQADDEPAIYELLSWDLPGLTRHARRRARRRARVYQILAGGLHV